MAKVPSRAEAYELLTRYVKSVNLINHALAVEAVMAHFAERFAPDEVEKWRVIGLVHDLDYEQYPDEHCQRVKGILEAEGWPSEYIRAIQSHGWQICTDVEPKETMEKVLYTIDELTGLVVATVLMRPSRSILDLSVSSLKKKWKQKNFAAGVNREVVEAGAEMLGMDLDEIFAETIKGMQKAAKELGLAGEAGDL